MCQASELRSSTPEPLRGLAGKWRATIRIRGIEVTLAKAGIEAVAPWAFKWRLSRTLANVLLRSVSKLALYRNGRVEDPLECGVALVQRQSGTKRDRAPLRDSAWRTAILWAFRADS